MKQENFAAETNECLLRLVSFAVWCSRLCSNDDLFEAVRLFCSFTHVHELVIESCYLYCYTIRLLIVNNYSMNKAYKEMMEESDRRAKISGCSTVKYWLENDVLSFLHSISINFYVYQIITILKIQFFI